MPRWTKADRALLADLRARHSVAAIAREDAKAPTLNGKRGRPQHDPDDVMLNALDFFRAVEIRHKDGGTFAKACEHVAKEATARWFKVSARTVRALHAAVIRWVGLGAFDPAKVELVMR